MRKFRFATAFLLMISSQFLSAQTVKTHMVEDGGTGPYKAEVVQDASLPTHTIYRPKVMAAAVRDLGRLPVIVYANGACMNNNVQMRLLLSEVASHGYLAIAIGPYDEENTVEEWKSVLLTAYPEEKKDVILATGERFKKPTSAEVEAAKQARNAKQAAARAKDQGNAQQTLSSSDPKSLLFAIDWITGQYADANSEYYHMVDLDKIAAMGQSCGGSVTLGVAHDPRIKTCVMLNSGIGEMVMSGVSKSSLNSLHTPMLYLIGGKTDIAYLNAADDFANITNVPVVMYNSHDGHNGTYYEKFGGTYASLVWKWLDWQLKGQLSKSTIFLNDDYAYSLLPNWTFQRKNF